MNGVGRGSAHLVSRDAQNRPAYGGTPSDSAVVQAIQELKARGYRVTFYPFILMDVPADNDLPDPYSDNAAATGQPAYPWRGRITCSPAAATPAASTRAPPRARRSRPSSATPSRPTSTSTTSSVEWDGDPDDWGLRRMILHYAHLCAAAGGVDAFLIGSELRGITQVRERRVELSGGRRARRPRGGRPVDPRVRHRSSATPPTGRSTSGTTRRTARATSSSTSTRSGRTTTIDFVGIDNYMPLVRLARRARPSRRRERRRDHRPRLPARQRRGRRGLRLVLRQRRRPRGAGPHADHRRRRRQAVGLPLQGHSRAGGRTRTATARAGSRAARRRRGCRRASRSASPRSAARRSTAGRTSRTSSTTRSRPRASCRTSPAAGATTRCSGASSRRRSATGPSRRTTRCPASTPGRMITTAETAAWTWDARPYPAFPARSDVWTDADNWRLGHWLNGRLGSVSLGSLVRELCRRAGLPDDQIDASALADVVHGYLISALESPRASIAPLARQFGFDAVESEGDDPLPAARPAAGGDARARRSRGRRARRRRGDRARPRAGDRAAAGAEVAGAERRGGLRRDDRRGAARHRRGAARHLRELRHRHDRQRRRPALPPGAARGMGRPRDRVVPAAAVAPGARSRRRRAARPRRPADLAAADLDRRRRRAPRRGGAHRRRRLRAGARTRAGAAGAEAGGLRAAERRLPRPAAAPRERPGAPAARGRLHRALAGPGRGLAQPGRGRLRAGHHARPAGADRDGSSPISIQVRRRASTSATSPSSISPSARSRASPTSRSSAAPTRWRSRRRRASGRCCSSASPS